MMKKLLHYGFLAGLLLAGSPAALSAETSNSNGSQVPKPLLIPGKSSLFQRVITRPGAVLAPQPSNQNAQPVPGFSIFYVYEIHKNEQQKPDWIKVGHDSHGSVAGWIPAAKAISWDHTLIGAFTNPAGRSRTMFLKTEQDERKLILDPNVKETSQNLLRDAQNKKPGPVIALEPENFVDITKNFYLLPILEAQSVERDSGAPMRLLHVISAPSAPAAQGNASPSKLRDFRAGLVFVMDTTISMEPYIKRTQEAVRSIVEGIKNTAVSNNFRFGLVAYRDSLKDNPKLEYETKLYAKPDITQPVDAINQAIASVHDAKVSSKEFSEDPIAGIKTAIDDIDWSPFGGKYIILVTDAGARAADNPLSITHLGIEEIRQLAQSKGIAIFVIHLLTPEGKKNHASAARQYRALSRFENAGSLYFPVAGGSEQGFSEVVQQLSTSLLQQVANVTGRPVGGLKPKTTTQAMERKINMVSQAMRLAYVGMQEHTAAPDAVESYTTDRDLADPLKKSLDVRVLLTRNQLSDLAQSLQTILRTGMAGRTSPQTFFTQLRSAFAAAARNPNEIAHADKIGSLLGEYLEGLPYKSDIMNISEQDWLAMGAIAQRTILNNVASRLRLYEEYEAHPDLWIQLGGSTDPGEAMYPVPLEALP